MNKENDNEKPKTRKKIESIPIKFDRRRLVTIEEGHMSCNCGDTQLIAVLSYLCCNKREEIYTI